MRLGLRTPSSVVDYRPHDAATSPLSDDRHPSSAQIEAGNYKLGTISWNGLFIRIENPDGSVRAGVDPDGKVWLSKLRGVHYGYVRDCDGETVGSAKDGDKPDVFVGPHLDSDRVFVIDQVNADGTYDEAKCVIGARDEDEARALYLAQYSPGWRVGPISELAVDEFKQWLLSGNVKKPTQPSFFKADLSFYDVNFANAETFKALGAQPHRLTMPGEGRVIGPDTPMSPDPGLGKRMKRSGMEIAKASNSRKRARCPRCHSTNTGLLPPDFETCKCGDCGRNFQHPNPPLPVAKAAGSIKNSERNFLDTDSQGRRHWRSREREPKPWLSQGSIDAWGAVLRMDPVAVKPQRLCRIRDSKELRRAAQQIYDELEPVTTRTGLPVAFVKEGFRHTREHSGNRLVMEVVPSLPDLMRSARHLYSEAERDPIKHPSVEKWHVYAARARLNAPAIRMKRHGAMLFVRLVTWENKGRERLSFYDVQVVRPAEIERAIRRHNVAPLTRRGEAAPNGPIPKEILTQVAIARKLWEGRRNKPMVFKAQGDIRATGRNYLGVDKRGRIHWRTKETRRDDRQISLFGRKPPVPRVEAPRYEERAVAPDESPDTSIRTTSGRVVAPPPLKGTHSDRGMADVIRDPRLLPYFLTLDQVAALCQLSPRTIQAYCHEGVWKRGQHYTQPRRRRRYLRDAVIAWREERNAPSRTLPKAALCRADTSRSPELAAIIEREAGNGL